jgi:streptomycin 6-kinase
MRLVFGDAGADWVSGLPAQLRRAAERWELQLDEPFAELSYSYVAPAIRADGTEAVLKARFPDAEQRMEVPALRHFSGRGGVRLLEADEEQGLLLLERLVPGTMLSKEPEDDRATDIAAQLMGELWFAPRAGGCPDVAAWTRGIADHRGRFGGSGLIPREVFHAAEELRRELLEDQAEAVLLHGDLHHFNILLHGSEWRAIDPRGIVGERSFEIGPFLDNPRPMPKAALERRVEILCERLDLDRRRVLGWSIVYGVLSACWTLDSSEDGWQNAVELSTKLSEIAG